MLLNVLKFTYKAFVRRVNSASMALHMPVEHVGAVSAAITLLQYGHVIALPTDTVYGFACSAVDVNAINQLYQIKARDEKKPVAICVGRVSDVSHWAVVEHLPDRLLSSLLPGPVTLVLTCADNLEKSLTSLNKVGIRIPDAQFLINLCVQFNSPLALTSANLSSEPSSVNVEEFHALWDKLGGVFDGGSLGIGDSNRGASTVIDLSEPGFYKITRKGIAEENSIKVLNKHGLSPL